MSMRSKENSPHNSRVGSVGSAPLSGCACGALDACAAELESTRRELERREKYLEDFRSGVFRMITDLDRSETELKGALQKLGETRLQLVQSSKLTALGELSASLVHEISQPLTVIKGLSRGLLLDEARSEHNQKISLIMEAAKKMEALVSHLKTFSRAETPAFEPIDINSVIKESFLLLGELLRGNAIDIRLSLGQAPVINGNTSRLEQVIINLVTNAKDAMPSGGALTITTSTVAEGGRESALIVIKDTGPGIDPEIAERIFDPFFTTKGAGKGTGLGLSITSGIIREHLGSIRVENGPEGGAAFQITIPALGR